MMIFMDEQATRRAAAQRNRKNVFKHNHPKSTQMLNANISMKMLLQMQL